MIQTINRGPPQRKSPAIVKSSGGILSALGAPACLVKGLEMIEKFVRLVKQQIAHYQGQIDRHPPTHPRHDPKKQEMYERIAREHRALLAYLEGKPEPQAAPESSEPLVQLLAKGQPQVSSAVPA